MLEPDKELLEFMKCYDTLKNNCVEFISTEMTFPLRLEVLWKHKKTFKECRLDTDDIKTTFHVGVMKEGKIVSVGTFLEQRNKTFNEEKQYRLRAMATLPIMKNSGYGKQIVEFACKELKNRKIEILWCDAREKAVGFYEKLGFQTKGDFYDIPLIGKHKLMYYKLK